MLFDANSSKLSTLLASASMELHSLLQTFNLANNSSMNMNVTNKSNSRNSIQYSCKQSQLSSSLVANIYESNKNDADHGRERTWDVGNLWQRDAPFLPLTLFIKFSITLTVTRRTLPVHPNQIKWRRESFPFPSSPSLTLRRLFSNSPKMRFLIFFSSLKLCLPLSQDLYSE